MLKLFTAWVCMLICAHSAIAQCASTLRVKFLFSDSIQPKNLHVDVVGSKLSGIHINDSSVVLFPLCKGSQVILLMDGGIILRKYQVAISTSILDTVLQFDGFHFSTSAVGISGSREEASSESKSQYAEKLTQNPAVTFQLAGSTIQKPVIEGMSGLRLAILTNGIRLESQTWGSEHAPEIDPFPMTAQLLTGPITLLYASDSYGGVVQLNTDSKQKTSVFLQGNSNGRGGMLAFQHHGLLQNNAAWKYQLKGSVQLNGDLNAPRFYLNNTGSNAQFIYGNLEHQKGKVSHKIQGSVFNSTVGILSVSHIGNLTDLQRIIQGTAVIDTFPFSYQINRPKQEIQHWLLAYSFEKNHWKASISNQYNYRSEFDKHRSRNDSIANLNLPELEMAMNSTSFDLQRTLPNSNFSLIKFSSLFKANDYSGRFFIPAFNAWSNAISAFYKKKSIEASIRIDQSSLFNVYRSSTLLSDTKSFVGVSGGIEHSFAKWKLSVMSQWRAPSAIELFSNGLHHGAGGYELGDPSLKSERVNTIRLISNFKANHFNFVLDGFGRFATNYINLEPTGNFILTVRGAFPEFKYQAFSIWMAGINFKSTFSKSYKFGQLKSTLIASALYNRKTDGTYLFGMPPIRANLNFEYVPESQSTWVESISVNLDANARQFLYTDGTDFIPPPNGFCLLNAQLSFQNPKKQSMIFGLKAQNITNQTYRIYTDRFRYFAPMPGFNLSVWLKYSIK